MQTRTWFNGAPAEGGMASPEGLDRGMAFGDGIFETMLLRTGMSPAGAGRQQSNIESAIHLFDLHLKRLATGMQVLGMDCPQQLVRDELQDVINCLETGASEGGEHQARRYFAFKLVISRGYSSFGYRCENSGVNRTILARDLPEYVLPPACKVGLCEVQLAAQPLLAGIKHCNRLEQVLARREVEARGLDEGLMLDQQGNIVEATSANLFIVSGDHLVTPPLKESGVAGVMREFISSVIAPQLGISVVEETIGLERLYSSDAVMLTNALSGVRQVSFCESREWKHSPLLQMVQEQVHESMVSVNKG